MYDMNTSVAPSIDGTHVTTVHDFDGEGDGAAEPSAELPSGYVSDAELLAWLQAKSTLQNNDLREQMKISTDRQDLIKDLKDLQSDITNAKSAEDIEAIQGKIESLLANDKYKPYAVELTELFDSALKGLDHSALNEPDDGLNRHFAEDTATVHTLTDPITNLTDKLGKVDSLALVQIQQLMSDAKETSQLASNVLSSRDQTSGSIIGNIRG